MDWTEDPVQKIRKSENAYIERNRKMCENIFRQDGLYLLFELWETEV